MLFWMVGLILSKEIVAEFQRVIARKKFKFDKNKQAELTNFILNPGRIVRVYSKLSRKTLAMIS